MIQYLKKKKSEEIFFQTRWKDFTPKYIHIFIVSYGTGNYSIKVAINKSGTIIFHQKIDKYQYISNIFKGKAWNKSALSSSFRLAMHTYFSKKDIFHLNFIIEFTSILQLTFCVILFLSHGNANSGKWNTVMFKWLSFPNFSTVRNIYTFIS